jgi:hypothetical protein
MENQEKAKSSKKGLFIIIAIVIVFGAIFGDKKSSTSSRSSSSSYSSSAQVKCGWCGKSFEKGTGYNTLMRIINQPEAEYSHYCSRRCASDFLRSN